MVTSLNCRACPALSPSPYKTPQWWQLETLANITQSGSANRAPTKERSVMQGLSRPNLGWFRPVGGHEFLFEHLQVTVHGL